MWRGKSVAVKRITTFLDSGARDAFVRELTVISGLRHPNICLFMGASLGSAPGSSTATAATAAASAAVSPDRTGSKTLRKLSGSLSSLGSISSLGVGLMAPRDVEDTIAIVNEYLKRGSSPV